MISRRALRSRVLSLAPGAVRPADLSRSRPALPVPTRLAVVRPDHVGDLLLSGPAVARLRRHFPDADVALVVGPWSRAVASRLPGVDRVVTIDFPYYDRRASSPIDRLRRLRAAAAALRAESLSAAVVLRDDDYWSAWALALAGVPVRAGHEQAGPFVTHALPVRLSPPHVAAAGVRLVAALAGAADEVSPEADPLAFRRTPADDARADSLLARSGASPSRPLAIHPGSGSAIKRWRPAAWAAVVDALADPGDAVVLTGTAAEADLTASVASATDRPTIDLAGRTDLGTLAAVLARCRLVLGPDSGPLHLAVAVGTPTVHLFGPADAARFGPWGPASRHRVVAAELPCAPCGRLDWRDPDDHPCVRTLSVDAVISAARAVLGG